MNLRGCSAQHGQRQATAGPGHRGAHAIRSGIADLARPYLGPAGSFEEGDEDIRAACVRQVGKIKSARVFPDQIDTLGGYHHTAGVVPVRGEGGTDSLGPFAYAVLVESGDEHIGSACIVPGSGQRGRGGATQTILDPEGHYPGKVSSQVDLPIGSDGNRPDIIHTGSCGWQCNLPKQFPVRAQSRQEDVVVVGRSRRQVGVGSGYIGSAPQVYACNDDTAIRIHGNRADGFIGDLAAIDQTEPQRGNLPIVGIGELRTHRVAGAGDQTAEDEVSIRVRCQPFLTFLPGAVIILVEEQEAPIDRGLARIADAVCIGVIEDGTVGHRFIHMDGDKDFPGAAFRGASRQVAIPDGKFKVSGPLLMRGELEAIRQSPRPRDDALVAALDGGEGETWSRSGRDRLRRADHASCHMNRLD